MARYSVEPRTKKYDMDLDRVWIFVVCEKFIQQIWEKNIGYCYHRNRCYKYCFQKGSP